MFFSSLSKPVVGAMLLLALTACKSDAERADQYYQSGKELLETGDTGRAMVEFRNAFEFDSAHLPTRQAMAKLFMSQGNSSAAYGQYLAIAEQYPENFEARRALAELAFEVRNWEEFVRHGTVAVEMSPEDPRVKTINLGLQYREAALAEDGPKLESLLAPAEALLASQPDSQILNNVLIDRYSRNGTMSKALARSDALIEADPENRQLYNQRLAMLAQLQDNAAIEAQLLDMVERFPGDQEVQTMLLRYYVSQQELDRAEAFLREISDPAAEDPTLFLNLIQFVSQTRGDEAARGEIERAIAESPKPNRYKAMLAMLDFQAGSQDEAVADLEAILAEVGPEADSAEIHGVKTILARMFVSMGNQVGARQLVDEVLAEDANYVDALKMKAAWQVRSDDTDAAIASLRRALDAAPEDVQAMNLMYEAYTRTGDADLARDFLALAVEASGNAPEASLRYARVLIQEERLLPAEDVLLSSLRINPGNFEVLNLLAVLYLRMEDIPRATQTIDTLRRLDTEQAIEVANGLQAELLNQQSGTDEALQFLENLAAAEDTSLQSKLTLLRARLSVGKTEEALRMAEEIVAENPDNLGLKQALASTQVANGDLDAAKISLREITSAAPDIAVNAWMQLIGIAEREGNSAQAVAIIEEALSATGDSPAILWAKAGVLERDRDIDGAIDIYQTLYDQNSGAIIVANNLASLLSTYRDDAESLERAWVIARRLRDTNAPAFQDTYGWIAFRRGNAEEALPYLENASAGLSEDPVVQVHLGFVYAALERHQEALGQMQKAVDLAGPADTRDKIEQARAEIKRLRALTDN